MDDIMKLDAGTWKRGGWGVGLCASLMLTGITAGASAQAIEGDPANWSPDKAAQNARKESGDGGRIGAEGLATMLPQVRLTPRDVSVAGLDSSRLDLNGEWDFTMTVPEGFDGTAGSVKQWGKMQVPGHPALQGHGKMHKEMGVPFAYHRSFDVPAEWKGKRVVLRFEGIDGKTKVWVNGQPAGENEIATLPSEFDITQQVKFGQSNELVLTVEKSLVTYWSRRELGGITRPAYVQALPKVNLARLHVDTELNDDYTHAIAHARIRVANESDEVINTGKLVFKLTGPDGSETPIDLKAEYVPLTPIAPGQMLEAVIPLPVAEPLLWSAESPSLYTLSAELKVGDEATMTARQKFGFREVTVDGPLLKLNGVPLKLRGTNYHITYPGLSESVPRDLIKRDLELFKLANFNTLRSRPTPSYDYVELCDELGMYTTVEAMISLMMYDKGPLQDHGADPSIAPGLRQHIATMIESYYSNPSVLTWGLGNECPYYDYFKVAAVGMHEADHSRPLFFGSDARLGVDIPFVDINDDHYPRAKHGEINPPFATMDVDNLHEIGNSATWDYPPDRPQIFTEWLHVHTNNVKEIAYDPGIDDFWGYYAVVHMNQLYQRENYAGGFHFKGAPYRGIGASPDWRGVFEDYRRINDIHWHVKKSHTPVHIENTVGEYDASAGVARFEVVNRFDFTNLKDLAIEWSAGGESGTVTPDVAPHATGTLEIPLKNEGEPIMLTIKGPDGAIADQYLLHTADPTPQVTAVNADEPFKLDRKGGDVVLSRGDVRYVIDGKTGLISSGGIGDQQVITGPISTIVRPSQLRNFQWQAKLTLVNQCADWQVGNVKVDEGDDEITVTTTGKYNVGNAKFTQRFARDGSVTVDYKLDWTKPGDEFNVFTTGLNIPVGEAFDTLRWTRTGLWSYYPADHIGRLSGEAPAKGDPAYESQRASFQPGQGVSEPWPWSQDLIHGGVTRDFRSTKFNLIQGGLYADGGAGITVLGHGKSHLQATPLNDNLGGNIFTQELHPPMGPGYDLQVIAFHNGGTEPHLTKSIRIPDERAKQGWSMSGSATFMLTAE